MGLEFQHPQLLSFLAAVPALALFLYWAGRRRKRLLERFAHPAPLAKLSASVSPGKRRTQAAFLLVAVGLSVFCLARPQYGYKERPIERKGVDLFIAIDTSDSMLANDVHPSRLARAQDQLKQLIRKLKGDRVGIIAFAGEAFVQCPLTLDYGLAQRILETVGPDTIPVKGTAIGDTIRVALSNLEENEIGHKTLVLLTDGEDSGSEPLEAAEEAAKAGMTIYAIGIGTELGAAIQQGPDGVKRNAEGFAVNSRLDFETLQKIAAATGGAAIRANESGFLEIDTLYEIIQGLDQKKLRSVTRSLYEERFQYFLLPAIVCLGAYLFINDRRSVKAMERAEEAART
jgi:Ca-activated chloride channel family protein